MISLSLRNLHLMILIAEEGGHEEVFLLDVTIWTNDVMCFSHEYSNCSINHLAR